MKRAGPGWLLLALAGLAAVFGAFLPFYTYASGIHVTVWSRGLFPTAALIPLLGVAVGLEALFVLVRGHEPRSPFLNFTWEQARLAAGAFMIVLSLSYLVQDRAGGSLGIGFVLLSASSLATFAGGVLTRRAELARAGEEQERRPVIGPALASVGRASSDLVKNVADRSQNMRVRLAERREARAAARKDAAEKAAARRAEMQAEAAKAAAARATVEKAAAEEAQAANAAAEKATAAAAASAAAAAKAAAEQLSEEPAQPAPPTATVEALPTEPHPPAATLDELPAELPAKPPLLPAPHAEAPAADHGPSPDEPDDTAELPVADTAEADDDKTVDQPRVGKLSTVASDTEPDATPPPDGEKARDGGDATVERASATDDRANEHDEDSAKEKESAESSQER
ncbi:MAG TPA: hypothetical protein VFA62_01410 [Acidimicrobiia bacterium]|nr:hypothetical protein [Acidimicrobiia bacterium]